MKKLLSFLAAAVLIFSFAAVVIPVPIPEAPALTINVCSPDDLQQKQDMQEFANFMEDNDRQLVWVWASVYADGSCEAKMYEQLGLVKQTDKVKTEAGSWLDFGDGLYRASAGPLLQFAFDYGVHGTAEGLSFAFPKPDTFSLYTSVGFDEATYGVSGPLFVLPVPCCDGYVDYKLLVRDDVSTDKRKSLKCRESMIDEGFFIGYVNCIFDSITSSG